MNQNSNNDKPLPIDKPVDPQHDCSDRQSLPVSSLSSGGWGKREAESRKYAAPSASGALSSKSISAPPLHTRHLCCGCARKRKFTAETPSTQKGAQRVEIRNTSFPNLNCHFSVG